jgi:2-polyprenyl-3-methyl-5-hydroxy-6-metoxy-1,4-benzoquinol methylase
MTISDTTTASTTSESLDPDDLEAATGAFAERLFGAGLEAFELLTVFVGDELGLYSSLAGLGDATPPELAATAGIDARYAREWLEQQATAGIVDVVREATDGDPDHRGFALPAAHAEVLVNRDSLAYLAPLARLVVGAGKTGDAVVDAYRSGAGISFGGYGAEIRIAQADMNRAQFVNLLTSTWLPAMPDVVARLESAPSVIADVGCGGGWSSISIARAFPKARVHGFDLDEESIRDARNNADVEGVSDRVTFEVRDAADVAPGAYDLVCMFEALHDTGRPIDVLAALRAMAGPDGTVLVMDERVADSFTALGDPTERFLYAASVLHCLLVGRTDEHNHATGTMLRTPVMRTLVEQAGFRSFEVLPIEHDFWRFYRLGG